MNGRHFRGIFFLTALYHCSGSMTYFWESLPTIFPERNSNFLVTPSYPLAPPLSPFPPPLSPFPLPPPPSPFPLPPS